MAAEQLLEGAVLAGDERRQQFGVTAFPPAPKTHGRTVTNR